MITKGKEIFFVFTDGASRGNPGPCAGAFLIYRGRKLIKKGGEYFGEGTNNEAEYRAVLLALEELKKRKIKEAVFFLDSLFVVKQLKGDFRLKHPRMQKLYLAIKRLIWETGLKVSFRYIPRAQNKEADKLVNQILDRYLKGTNGKV